MIRPPVTTIETDYLVVGGGVSAMAFVDTLLDSSPARVTIVDRRHAPGGHWLDAYPFVRLHMPSANYGLASTRLGQDRVDTSGQNAGMYERASPYEIREYLARVLEERFLPSGRVSFLGLSDYRGEDADGHHVVSLLTGADVTIRARKLVDATYVQSEIPSRHTPAFQVEPGARVIAPNDLVNLTAPPGEVTVIGAGKTAMDTCVWMLDAGLDPDRIVWIRPRDAWVWDRARLQPLELVASYMQTQARWVEAAAAAVDGDDFAHRLEAAGVFWRIDPQVEPEAYRGAIVSAHDLERLRAVERVVRGRRVRAVGTHSIDLSEGHLPTRPDALHVDCTAAGVPAPEIRPVFAPGRITLQYLMIGNVSWGAATIGWIEANREDDDAKNRLSPPVVLDGKTSGLLEVARAGMTGLLARLQEPDLAAWTESCRLNPAAGAMARIGEPEIGSALAAMASNMGPALENLARRAPAPDVEATAPL